MTNATSSVAAATVTNAPRAVDLGRLETRTTARLHRELVDRSPLGVALGRRDHDDLLVRDRAPADHAVVALQLDSPHAPRAPAHGPHVGLGEPDSLPGGGHEQQLVVVPAGEHAHDPVVVGELHRDDPVLAARRVRELRQRGAFHASARGHEDDVRVLLVHPCVEHRDHALSVAELEQVLRGRQPVLGQLVHRRAVRAAPIGEEQHARERRRVDHLSDRVALAGVHGPASASSLGHRPHVAARGDGDEIGLVFHQRDHVDRARIVGDDLGPPGRLVLVANRRELGPDHTHQNLALRQDALELLHGGRELLGFVRELVASEPREPAERHVEDVVGLHLGEPEPLAHQRVARRAGRPTRGSP